MNRLVSLSNRVSFKGVIVGAVVDVVGTNIWAFCLFMYMLAAHLVTVEGLKDPNFLLFLMINHPFLYGLNLLMGLLFSVFGGYVAASIAKRDELLNATLSSFVCVVSVVYGIVIGFYSFAFFIALLLLNPLLALVGGYLRQRRVWAR